MSTEMTYEQMMANQAALDKEVEDVGGHGGGFTDRVPTFKLTFNADGAASARIRLLPPGPNGGRFVFKYREHSVDKPRFMSTTCPTTFGEHCPACEKGWEYHKEGDSVMRSKLLGRERYVVWVYVIADPLNPSNVGKILLYQYGRMIAKMIEDKLKPSFGDEDPVNVFRMDAGCDLIIKAVKVNNIPKFDGTYFADASEMKLAKGGPDKTLKDMWMRIPSLEDEFIGKIEPTDHTKLAQIMRIAIGGDDAVAEVEAHRAPTQGGMPRPQPRTEVNTAPVTTQLTQPTKTQDEFADFDDDIPF